MPSVGELMVAAEKADDQYAECVINAARARAEFERAFALAKLEAIANGDKGVSDRNDFADAQCADERAAFLIAEALEKAAKVHVQTILGLMVAAQSQQKFRGKQDGGDWEL